MVKNNVNVNIVRCPSASLTLSRTSRGRSIITRRHSRPFRTRRWTVRPKWSGLIVWPAMRPIVVRLPLCRALLRSIGAAISVAR